MRTVSQADFARLESVSRAAGRRAPGRLSLSVNRPDMPPGTAPRSGALHRVNQLLRLAEAMARGDPLAATDRQWFAEAVQSYVQDAASGVSLEDALGLSPTSPGQEHWTTTRSRQRRDAAIRALGTRPPFAKLKITEAAREIAAAARQFQHTGRAAKRSTPLTSDPEIEVLLTEALCTGQRFPGPRQIQSILEIK